jgi:hypothetical protein
MNEIISTELLNEKEDKEENSLIHSLEYRNPFQMLIFKMLNIKDNDFEQVMKYSKIIRSIIDDPDHTKVRKLIIQKKFEEAANIVIAEIHKEEYQPKAA